MEKSVQVGVVGFFDILGYKNVLENNDVNACAEIIKEILVKNPEKIKEKILKIGKDAANLLEDKGNVVAMMEEIFDNHYKQIMVSDSIILFFDFDDIDGFKKTLSILMAFHFMAFFQAESFFAGFPMRACIDIGPFYYYDNLFAGDTIVNCYTEADKLDFSGLIMTDRANHFLNLLKEVTGLDTIRENTIRYLVPLKNNREEYKYLLNWFDSEYYKTNNDIEQQVFEVFHMHNKIVNNVTMNKINNTERIIRYFLFKDK